MQTLLIGYGTLLSQASLGNTIGGNAASQKRFVPVVVQGYRRLFNLRPDHYEPSCVLGVAGVEAAAANVEPAVGERFNALAFPVSADELAQLDARERYYERVETAVATFGDERPFGAAFVYVSRPDARWIERDPMKLLPLWRDIELARGGAYGVGADFGAAYDRTTYLADGETLLAQRYAAQLRPSRG